ncbi:zf-DNL-domain-containing protein [Dipodascopsis uninucleata]
MSKISGIPSLIRIGSCVTPSLSASRYGLRVFVARNRAHISNYQQQRFLRSFTSNAFQLRDSKDKKEDTSANLSNEVKEVARVKIPVDKPTYNITFTCKVCQHRSSHFMSHQAYHSGTVLIKCPSCNNRHLIADHLKIFSDTSVTVEDLISKGGEVVRKGTLTETRGDILEFTDSDESSSSEKQ